MAPARIDDPERQPEENSMTTMFTPTTNGSTSKTTKPPRRHHPPRAGRAGDVVFDLPEIGRTFQKAARWRASSNRSRPRPTSRCRSAARSSRSTRRCAPTLRSPTRPAGQRLVLQGAHLRSRHGRVRPADGHPAYDALRLRRPIHLPARNSMLMSAPRRQRRRRAPERRTASEFVARHIGPHHRRRRAPHALGHRRRPRGAR